jgi:hypothetical protein
VVAVVANEGSRASTDDNEFEDASSEEVETIATKAGALPPIATLLDTSISDRIEYETLKFANDKRDTSVEPVWFLMRKTY